MKKIAFFSMAALAMLFTACSEPTASVAPAFSLDSAKATIAASNKVYSESFAKNDSVAFVGCYASDAVLMAPQHASNGRKRSNKRVLYRRLCHGYKGS